MEDRSYREGYVQSQIRTVLPFQLRALRKSRGPEWTQAYLAERTGMAQPRISELEKATGSLPNLDTLCRIASGLDIGVQVKFVPFSELIRFSEEFDPEACSIKTFEEELAEAKAADNFLGCIPSDLQTGQKAQPWPPLPNQEIMGLARATRADRTASPSFASQHRRRGRRAN
jgi:transcriptional regulator with XRE-family HTH domain